MRRAGRLELSVTHLRPPLRALRLLPAILLGLAPMSARAEDAFCPARPGQTTPPCVTAPGQTVVEAGLAAWTRGASSSGGEDQFTLAAPIVRFGLTPGLEAQIGWAGLTWSPDSAEGAGTQSHRGEPGDLTLGALYGPGGPDAAFAVQGFVTLPTGQGRATAGDWSAGVRIPLARSLGGGWQVALTPEADLAVNASGKGRHAAFGVAAGASREIREGVVAGVDISLFRDLDPEGDATRSAVSATLAWQVSPNAQFDIGAGFGLTADSPRTLISIGFARRL
jgi:hypothetical protein